MDMNDQKTRESVKEYYGKVLSSTESLKTSACVPSSRPHPLIIKALKLVPESVKAKYYGCGSAVPLGIRGLDLLDLGSGSGQDCFIAASLGAGSVIGIDMTEEQLQVARDGIPKFVASTKHAGKIEFRQGLIEDLKAAGVQDESIHIVISNCVVNLSPRKDLVLKESFRILRWGGEFYFSDVYCDRRLPEHVKKHEVLWGECIAGAMYVNDFITLCHEVGFKDPRQIESHPIDVDDPELLEVVGNAKFFSITFRLFKLRNLERLCEDYGQVAVYKGTIDGHKHSYLLDDHHEFVTGKPALVCGNTASMLEESWLKPHFAISGDRSIHYGEFPCGPSAATAKNYSEPSGGDGGACGSGECGSGCC